MWHSRTHRQNRGNQAISSCEEKLRDSILAENPDCLVYDSHARKGGENYIFFERGFAKLSLREVTLRLGSRPSKNRKTITCALGSDYYPVLESYGNYFLPIAKEKEDLAYLSSDEYACRKKAYDFYWSPLLKKKLINTHKTSIYNKYSPSPIPICFSTKSIYNKIIYKRCSHTI